MDKAKAASDIIARALPDIAFDGWTLPVLERAAHSCGYRKEDIARIFPGGPIDAIEFFVAEADAAMIAALKEMDLPSMKIRQRIASAIRVRLERYTPHREAVRRALATLALPIYAHRALKGLYRTVDAIWYEAGDTSTDYNYYSKRATLAAVYSATVLFWLNDSSKDCAETWAFLDRRIENVMSIEKAKQKLRGLIRI